MGQVELGLNLCMDQLTKQWSQLTQPNPTQPVDIMLDRQVGVIVSLIEYLWRHGCKRSFSNKSNYNDFQCSHAFINKFLQWYLTFLW